MTNLEQTNLNKNLSHMLSFASRVINPDLKKAYKRGRKSVYKDFPHRLNEVAVMDNADYIYEQHKEKEMFGRAFTR